jgi:hypothetical protein
MNAVALPANSDVRRPLLLLLLLRLLRLLLLLLLLLLLPVLQKLSSARMGRRNVQSSVKAALDPGAKKWHLRYRHHFSVLFE